MVEVNVFSFDFGFEFTQGLFIRYKMESRRLRSVVHLTDFLRFNLFVVFSLGQPQVVNITPSEDSCARRIRSVGDGEWNVERPDYYRYPLGVGYSPF